MKNQITMNKVEGFDPKEYARTIEDANGQEALYLDVQYRKMWFRLCNPNGKIVKKICTFDGNLAVVEARIYLDRNDPPESFISNAFAQRFVDPNNPNYGTRYLETAETAAVGRALADAGYGLQFCLEPDPTPVDSGQNLHMSQNAAQTNAIPPQKFTAQTPLDIIVNNMTFEEAAEVVYQSEDLRNPRNGKKFGELSLGDMQWFIDQYNGSNNLYKGAAEVIFKRRTSSNNNNVSEPQQPQAAFTPQTPVEEIVRHMPYEEAVKVVYYPKDRMNRNYGKTFGQMAVENITNLQWFANDYKGNNNLYKGAAKVILNRYTGGN